MRRLVEAINNLTRAVIALAFMYGHANTATVLGVRPRNVIDSQMDYLKRLSEAVGEYPPRVEE